MLRRVTGYDDVRLTLTRLNAYGWTAVVGVGRCGNLLYVINAGDARTSSETFCCGYIRLGKAACVRLSLSLFLTHSVSVTQHRLKA